eukprot:COSAG05_NODE_280_length_12288_cov_4.797933_17_plen_56_part_00
MNNEIDYEVPNQRAAVAKAGGGAGQIFQGRQPASGFSTGVGPTPPTVGLTSSVFG